MKNLALSTCWNASRHRDGKAMLEEIAQMGFQSVELGHNLRYSLFPGVLKAVEQKIIQVVSLHNFCPVPIEVTHPSPDCYEFTSDSASERAAATRATLQTLEAAAQLKASVVVLHLGSFLERQSLTDRLIDRWKNRTLFTKKTSRLKIEYLLARRKAFGKIQKNLDECLKPILAKAAELKIRLGAEFRCRIEEFPHPDEFDFLFREYEGSPLGYWHDFGHAGRMEVLGFVDQMNFYQQQLPRMLGAHWQDLTTPDRDHLALGEGDLPLRDYFKMTSPEMISVLELSPKVSPESVIESHRLWKNGFPW